MKIECKDCNEKIKYVNGEEIFEKECPIKKSLIGLNNLMTCEIEDEKESSK